MENVIYNIYLYGAITLGLLGIVLLIVGKVKKKTKLVTWGSILLILGIVVTFVTIFSVGPKSQMEVF